MTLRSVFMVIVTIVVVVPVVAMTVMTVMTMAMVTMTITLRTTSVRVPHFGEVLGSGTHMQLLEHLVRAFVAEELGHTAVLITQVTKDDRIG